MLGTSLSFVDTTNILGAISERLLSVEGSLNVSLVFTYVFTGHTLHKYFGVLINENIRLSLFGVDSSLQSIDEALLGAQTPCQHKDL